MKEENYIIFFKRLIIAYFLLFFIYLLKFLIFPDATIPSDLSYLVRRYEDEISPNTPVGLVIFYAILIILFYISLYKIYKFKNIYRYVFLFSYLGLITFPLVSQFNFTDSIDQFLEFVDYTLGTMIFTMSFLPPVKYKFEESK